MAATVLNSQRAVEVSVFAVRAYVKLRQLALAYKELAAKLEELEKKVTGHDDAIRQLAKAPAPSPTTGRIGFRVPGREEPGQERSVRIQGTRRDR